jgi:peptide/nickel transport system substrate-binding protein
MALYMTDAQSHHFNANRPSRQIGRGVWFQSGKKIEDLYVTGSQKMEEVKRKLIYNEFQLAQEQVPFIYLVNAQSWLRLAIGLKGSHILRRGEALWNLHELPR